MLYTAWTYLSESFVLQLFTVSIIALLLGIAQKVWSEAWRLRFLEATPIRSIEFEHPHIPSRRAILTIFFCSVALLVVSVQTLGGMPFLGGPFAWMQLAGFFALAGSAGALAELRWKGTRDVAFAVVTGSAIAFLTIIYRFSLSTHQWSSTLLYALLLLLCLFLAWRTLFRYWSASVQLTALIMFVLWIFLSL